MQNKKQNPSKSKSNQGLIRAGLLSLTLGLAPFNPPHIVGKIQWILGGGVGMERMDFFDLLLHGSPWLLLVFLVVKKIVNLVNSKTDHSQQVEA